MRYRCIHKCIIEGKILLDVTFQGKNVERLRGRKGGKEGSIQILLYLQEELKKKERNPTR